MLDWSWIIATANRFDLLPDVLKTALWQTRRPRQVIVVDSHKDWQAHREWVMSQIAPANPDIEWIYVGSDVASASFQRNLGLGHCAADIAFFFDDDAFPRQDCAEKILALYERDEEQRVGGIAAMLTPEHPLHPGGSVPQPSQSSISERFRAWLSRLWDQERLFIPYDGDYYRRDVDWLDASPEIKPQILFHGCRITFRTEAIRSAGGFSTILRKHCFGDDIDASYRVSRTRYLAVHYGALLYHAHATSGRAMRSVSTTLLILNPVALYRLHSRNPSVMRVWRFWAARLMAEMVRELPRPWQGFRGIRGALRCLPLIPRVWRMSPDEIRASYPQMQLDIYARVRS
jgi:hypothetical protein